MTRPVRPTLSVLLAALVVVLAASCTGDTTPPSPDTTSATSTPSTTTPTPTPTPTPSPEDAAALRAEEVVRAYLRAQTDCLTDPPTTEITCFDPVAIGTELVNLKNALTSAQAAETRVVGEINAASIELQGVDLTSDPAASPSHGSSPARRRCGTSPPRRAVRRRRAHRPTRQRRARRRAPPRG